MPGCHVCLPVAFDHQVVNGVLHCRACGRVVSDELELYVIGSMGAPPRTPNNSFERGIRRDERGLPYLDENGQPLRMKEPFDPRRYGYNKPVVLPARRSV